ncbi:MAG: tRNA (adenosine(37)-N6)-threonylcarbamoyltransferase complex ATPase subunit type 1 TsaE [Candidatus Hydrogenedentota bacterium]
MSVSTQELALETTAPEQTQAIGRALADFLMPGTVVALFGNLATGKTCFVHGVGEGFGVAEPVNSPTFTLVNEYHGTHTIYHLDLYRLTTAAELYDLGYEDILDAPDAICLIEWAERARTVLPKQHVRVRLEHAGEDARKITVEDDGVLSAGWQDAIRRALDQAS